jgi:hypothetical protein
MMGRVVQRRPEVGTGTQALGLLIGVIGSFAVGTAVASPFDLDVGTGHAIFHLVLGVGLGATAVWLWNHQPTRRAVVSQLALWSTAALAFVQLVEGVAAIPDAEGEGGLHTVPNVASLAVLQPLVVISLIALAVSALLRRRPAPE